MVATPRRVRTGPYIIEYHSGQFDGHKQNSSTIMELIQKSRKKYSYIIYNIILVYWNFLDYFMFLEFVHAIAAQCRCA